jgi:mannosyltransferase
MSARELRVIAPSLGTRYSGVNASLAAVLPAQAKRVPIAALGFHIPAGSPRVSWWRLLLLGGRARPRIWHARRNVEMMAGLILRALLRLPLLLVFTSAAQRRHSWVTRFLYGRMDAVIATSAAAASYLRRPAVVVPHGVDTRRFQPPADRTAAWAARGLPGRYGIGVLGRLRPQKGTEDFVDALVRVLPARPEWTAVIIGETTREFRRFEQRLRRKVEAAGLAERVRFTGFLRGPEDIPEWYRALSVVVCPSRNEGFGLPCLEAMASGCLVVATRTGAWPELIREGIDGHLVPCADPEALAGAVLKATEDPARAREMGERGRARVVEAYQIENEAAGIQSVYDRLFAARDRDEAADHKR